VVVYPIDKHPKYTDVLASRWNLRKFPGTVAIDMIKLENVKMKKNTANPHIMHPHTSSQYAGYGNLCKMTLRIPHPMIDTKYAGWNSTMSRRCATFTVAAAYFATVELDSKPLP
jgi:hypothetical protein